MSTLERRYHHGELRTALVETALGTLLAEPTAELSLRDLARKIGVSPAAPYRHFPNLTALLRAVAAEGFLRLAKELERVSGETATERLISMGQAYVGFAETNRSLYRLMFGPEIDRKADTELSEAMDAAFAPLAAAVAAVEPHDPIFGALGAWAMVHGLAKLIIDGQVAGLNANARFQFVQSATSIFVAGLGPPRWI